MRGEIFVVSVFSFVLIPHFNTDINTSSRFKKNQKMNPNFVADDQSLVSIAESDSSESYFDTDVFDENDSETEEAPFDSNGRRSFSLEFKLKVICFHKSDANLFKGKSNISGSARKL